MQGDEVCIASWWWRAAPPERRLSLADQQLECHTVERFRRVGSWQVAGGTAGESVVRRERRYQGIRRLPGFIPNDDGTRPMTKRDCIIDKSPGGRPNGETDLHVAFLILGKAGVNRTSGIVEANASDLDSPMPLLHGPLMVSLGPERCGLVVLGNQMAWPPREIARAKATRETAAHVCTVHHANERRRHDDLVGGDAPTAAANCRSGMQS
jgi:hypothetical protein